MAIIRPFKGVRYNQAVVGDLSKVVAPPYDVISPEEQVRYHEQHPNNVVRLILPMEDSNLESKYMRAASCLRDWLGEKVLIQDEEPCLYAYEQEFAVRGEYKKRLGFTCIVKLEDYESGTVLPHENTLAKPREDRLKIMRATRANLDSVFGLFQNGSIDAVLRQFTALNPDAVATDRDGVKSRLWRISDQDAIDFITQALANESIVIADGHHRYSAALAYRNEMRGQGGEDPEAPFEYVMMTLVSLEDSGLVVFPTHRAVRGVITFEPNSFITKLSELFDMKATTSDRLLESVEALGSMNHIFGLHMKGGKSYVLKLKPTVSPERVIGTPGSDALKRLDVSVLHSLILEKLLGIGVKQLASQSNLSYTRDVPAALKSVDAGENQMVFLMNPTRVNEVRAVAAAGDKMPQKSTFFYPKLLTGIVMRAMPRLVASR